MSSIFSLKSEHFLFQLIFIFSCFLIGSMKKSICIFYTLCRNISMQIYYSVRYTVYFPYYHEQPSYQNFDHDVTKVSFSQSPVAFLQCPSSSHQLLSSCFQPFRMNFLKTLMLVPATKSQSQSYMRDFYYDITQIPALNSTLAHLYSMMPVAFAEMALKAGG